MFFSPLHVVIPSFLLASRRKDHEDRDFFADLERLHSDLVPLINSQPPGFQTVSSPRVPPATIPVPASTGTEGSAVSPPSSASTQSGCPACLPDVAASLPEVDAAMSGSADEHGALLAAAEGLARVRPLSAVQLARIHALRVPTHAHTVALRVRSGLCAHR